MKRSSICPRDTLTRSAGRPRSSSSLPRRDAVTPTTAGATILRGRVRRAGPARIFTEVGENELTVLVDVRGNLVSLEKSSFEHRKGQRILNQTLDRSLERARTE